jgi:diguanylate cyclase (GGDEF)-like protein
MLRQAQHEWLCLFNYGLISKLVIDWFGHSTGDNLLRLMASGIRNNIRATDTIARLGGDAFAILLPQIGVELIQVVTKRIEKVSADVMREYGWPVTLSMGVVSFVSPPSTFDDPLKASDDLMYSPKKDGNNTNSYEVYRKEGAPQGSDQVASQYTSVWMENRAPEEAPASSLAGKYSWEISHLKWRAGAGKLGVADRIDEY